jgi:hypothetical protein
MHLPQGHRVTEKEGLDFLCLRVSVVKKGVNEEAPEIHRIQFPSVTSDLALLLNSLSFFMTAKPWLSPKAIEPG